MSSVTHEWTPTSMTDTGHQPPRLLWQCACGQEQWTADPDGPARCEHAEPTMDDERADETMTPRALAQWLAAMDEPGCTERRTVTLTAICQAARDALDHRDATFESELGALLRAHGWTRSQMESGQAVYSQGRLLRLTVAEAVNATLATHARGETPADV